MRTLLYSLVLLAFWLLLSGHFNNPLLVGLGLGSVLLTVFLAKRMNILDHESFPIQLSPKLPRFSLYLLKEISLSNLDVLRRILSLRKNPISPRVQTLPLPHKTDLGRVLYANAITLTPGTVTLELQGDNIIVHALSKESAASLATGQMAAAIPEVPAYANPAKGSPA